MRNIFAPDKDRIIELSPFDPVWIKFSTDIENDFDPINKSCNEFMNSIDSRSALIETLFSSMDSRRWNRGDARWNGQNLSGSNKIMYLIVQVLTTIRILYHMLSVIVYGCLSIIRLLFKEYLIIRLYHTKYGIKFTLIQYIMYWVIPTFGPNDTRNLIFESPEALLKFLIIFA